MKTNKLFYLGSIILVLSSTLSAYAIEPVIIDNNLKKKNIGLQIEYLVENDKTATIEKITSKRHIDQYKWIQSKTDKLSFGFTDNIYWIRFTVQNKSDNTITWYLHQEYPLIDYIDLYVPNYNNNTFRKTKTGDQFNFSERPVKYRSFVFPLSLKARTSQTCYMRYESSSSMNIHLVAWPPEEFNDFQQTESIILWVFITIMTTMFIYNLFIYSSIRDMSYFYYIFYILTFTLFVMSLNRMAFQYLWPQSTIWSNLSVPFFMGLIIFSIIQFCRYFAEIWNIAKKWEDMVLKIIMITGLCLSALTLITNHYRFSITSTTALTGIAASYGTYLVAKYGLFLTHNLVIRQARFLAISFLAFLIGISLFVLKTFAILPSTIITENAILIGAALEVMLLSFGLADRINTMKNELADLNQNLESKVSQRTDELNAAMEEMEAMNNNLVETVGELANTQYIAAQDMGMAATVQTALLPKEPPQVRGWDIAYIFKPMSGVSGDFYDFYEKNGILQGMSLMDVSGHGIASGLITMIARSVINRNFTNKSTVKLRELLEEINKDLISEMGDVENYLTGIILRITGNTIEYVNAAHPDLLHRRGDSKKITAINKKNHDFRGMFLGTDAMNNPFEQLSFKISDNDSLLLFTDCLQESHNSQKEEYSLQRVIDSFQTAPDDTAQQTLDHLLKEFYSFVGGDELNDDLTIIVAKKTD